MPTVPSRSEVRMTGTRCWPVVWLPGMPRMRSCEYAPGSTSGLAGGIDAVVDADDEARSAAGRGRYAGVDAGRAELGRASRRRWAS